MKSRITSALTVLALAGGTGGALAVAASSSGSGSSSANAQYTNTNANTNTNNAGGLKCGQTTATNPNGNSNACPNNGTTTTTSTNPAGNSKGKSSQHTSSQAQTVSDLQNNEQFDLAALAGFRHAKPNQWSAVESTLGDVKQDIAAAKGLGDSADLVNLIKLEAKLLAVHYNMDATLLNSALSSKNTTGLAMQLAQDYSDLATIQKDAEAAEVGLGSTVLNVIEGKAKFPARDLAAVARAVVAGTANAKSNTVAALKALLKVTRKGIAQDNANGNGYGADELTIQQKVITALLQKSSKHNLKSLKALQKAVSHKLAIASRHHNKLAANKLRLEKALLQAKIAQSSKK